MQGGKSAINCGAMLDIYHTLWLTYVEVFADDSLSCAGWQI